MDEAAGDEIGGIGLGVGPDENAARRQVKLNACAGEQGELAWRRLAEAREPADQAARGEVARGARTKDDGAEGTTRELPQAPSLRQDGREARGEG